MNGGIILHKRCFNFILFLILICLYLFFFNYFFGEENLMIGITSIISVMLFYKTNLTIKILHSVVFFTICNCILGLAALVSSSFIVLSVPINFFIIFIISFILYNSSHKGNSLSFILLYIFMISFPVSINDLPLRLLALLVNSLTIIIFQIFTNYRITSKESDLNLIELCEIIFDKINNSNKPIEIYKDYSKIKKYIYNIKYLVYMQRYRVFYISDLFKIKLHLTISLEIFIDIINDIDNCINLIYREKLINNIKDTIKIISRTLKNRNYSINDSNYLRAMMDSYKDSANENIIVYRTITNIDRVHILLTDLYNCKNTKLDTTEKIPKSLDIFDYLKNDFSINTTRFSYSFRIAISIALGAFILDLFNNNFYSFTLFSIAAFTQPRQDINYKKIGEGLMNVLLATIIIYLIFFFIRNTILEALIIILFCYLHLKSKTSKNRILYLCLIYLGSIALCNHQYTLSYKTMFCIFIGLLIATLTTRYVFPFTLHNASIDLININRTIIMLLLKSLINNPSMLIYQNFYLSASIVESRMIRNYLDPNNENIRKYTINQSKIILNLFVLYSAIVENNLPKETNTLIIDTISNYFKEPNNSNNITLSKLENAYRKSENIYSKYTIKSLINILNEIDKMIELSPMIIKIKRT